MRGVVIAHAVTNGPSPQPLVGLLRGTEASLRQRLTVEALGQDGRIRAWRCGDTARVELCHLLST
jgi:hypothetical protein